MSAVEEGKSLLPVNVICDRIIMYTGFHVKIPLVEGHVHHYCRHMCGAIYAHRWIYIYFIEPHVCQLPWPGHEANI